MLFWLNELNPFILVLYDATGDRAYWLDVQEAFAGGRIFEAARSGSRLTLRLQEAQALDGDAINEFRRRKVRAQDRFS